MDLVFIATFTKEECRCYILMPLFCIASSVRHLTLAIGQVMHFTLVGATLFHIELQGPINLTTLYLSHQFNILFTKGMKLLHATEFQLPLVKPNVAGKMTHHRKLEHKSLKWKKREQRWTNRGNITRK